MKFKKGDTVRIMKGKDVSKQARILRVIPDEGKAIVEGVNIYKKHVKGDGREKESAIVDVARPIELSNLRVICASCGKGVRVGYSVTEGKKLRVCKRCGKGLDVEVAAEKKRDGKKNKKETDKKKTPAKGTSKNRKTKSKSKK